MKRFLRNSHAALGKTAVAAVFLCAALAAPPSRADYYHYSNILIGERAAGMGGAYTALANDASAVFYNPAGLALVTDSSLSVSANMYGVVGGKFDNAYGAGNDLSYSSVHVVPSTFGAVKKLSEDSAIGFGAFVTDSLSYKSNKKGTLSINGTSADLVVESVYSEELLLFGAAYGSRLSPNLVAGVSVYYSNETMSSLNSFLLQSGSTVFETGQSIDYSHGSLYIGAGVLYQASETMTYGLSVTSPSVRVSGKGYVYDRDSSAGININRDDLATGSATPLKVRGGLAYSPFDSFKAAVDLAYCGARNFALFPDYSSSTTVDAKAVLNLAAGMEYHFGRVPVRAGFYTNRSAANEQNSWDWTDMDMYGLTFSVGHEDEHTTFNVGVNYLFGNGNTMGYDQNLNPVVSNVSQQRMYFFLGSSYFF